MNKEILQIGKVNQFDSIRDFVSYAEQHYVPLIAKLGSNAKLDDATRHLLGFFYDDFKSLVNELEKAVYD